MTPKLMITTCAHQLLDRPSKGKVLSKYVLAAKDAIRLGRAIAEVQERCRKWAPCLHGAAPANHINLLHSAGAQLTQSMRRNISGGQSLWGLQEDACAVQGHIAHATNGNPLDLFTSSQQQPRSLPL